MVFEDGKKAGHRSEAQICQKHGAEHRASHKRDFGGKDLFPLSHQKQLIALIFVRDGLAVEISECKSSLCKPFAEMDDAKRDSVTILRCEIPRCPKSSGGMS